MKYLVTLLLSLLLILGLGCSHTDQQTSNPFNLNEDELKLYESLKLHTDESLLQHVEPLTVAKLYVFSEYDSNFDVSYALYTQREGHIMWTKEEDQQIPKEHRKTKEKIIAMFKNIEKGTFIETSEYEGYIEYTNIEGQLAFFSMIKDESGIWKVAFMPIQ